MEKGKCTDCGSPMTECSADGILWYVCEKCGTELRYVEDNL